ncbi:M23 family metallopeptidase [Leptospira interrogans]|uniref:M23 family metallopeptidase n=1 Tax=Leptospira interrogans TaxID=173 RepID=UPI001F05C645|nr:M23 family metallopeptidase [Leptospira interrogans]MCH1887222.1 peptidoglycan DD-metalloendopeptidase family protein [Leptospira interrogans]
MDPNSNFDANKVADLKNYIDNLQKNVEAMFAQFSNKTNEIKEEYVQNKEIESYQKKLYEASKENYLAAFQALPGEFKGMFEGEMGGLKNYHEQGSKYNFGQGSFNGQSGDMKKVGKSMYDGVNIDDTVFAGSRELKGSVSVKGIPVEVSYGMQYLIVTSGFDISNLGYNFKLKGLGTSYVDNQLSGANQRYEIYKEDIQDRIERQAKSNDAEKESKGFIFTILNGMNGGSGSMGQRFTQAVRSEAQSRITGAVAEATGLPASLVGALVGGSSMKDAVKAYVKDETTNAISKATGLPTWLISNQMEKMNKPKEQWYQSQEFQMVTTVAAVVAAPLTGGASLMIAMAVNAGLGAATGAASGGLKGALVGAVGGAAGAAVRSFTGGAVTVGLSYSAENGFGASISKSLDNGINGSLSWSEKGGVGGNIGYEVPGDKNKSKDSLANKMQGSGGSLNWSQRDGVSVAVNASGGVNAGNWSQSGGFQANTNFLNDQWKANFISGKAKEDADAQEASRAAQNKNNAEQGAQAIEGMGVSGRKPEDGGDLSNGTHKPNGEPADPVDQRIAQLRKELSEGISLAHDNGTMSDAGNPALASAAKELSSKMNELKQLEGQKAASQKPGVQKDGSIVVVGSKTPTLSERAASLFGSVASGAKGLWDRATGGNQANIDPHQVVRIGENGLAEYANGARTSIAFNEKTDGPFSQPRTNTIHGAVDLMTPIGTKVSALEDGVVTIARNKPDDYLRYPVEPGKNTKLGGASVSIRHTNANGETVYTYYAHNSEVLVRDGQKVFKGQVIALSGQSGNTPGGPHIHQEVNKYVDGERVQIDPLEFSWEKFNANKN